MTREGLKGVETMPTLQVLAVTQPLGGGMGSVAPEFPTTMTESEAHAASLAEITKAVELGTPGGCIDGRVALSMLNGAEVKAGLKSAGANGITSYYGLEVTGFFSADSTPLRNFGHVVYDLEENGKPVGFHTDDKKAEPLKKTILGIRDRVAGMSSEEAFVFIEDLTPEELEMDATGCGASDALQGVNGKLSRCPQTKPDGTLETAEEVEARIEGAYALSGALAGEPVDRETFDTAVSRATELDEAGYFKAWNSVKALLVADVVLTLRGVGDGVLGRIQVLKDDGKGVHGHNESHIDVIMEDDKTLETKDIEETTGKKDFVVNAKQVAQQVAHTFNHPAAAVGAVMYQVGTKTQLTTGEQRGIILG